MNIKGLDSASLSLRAQISLGVTKIRKFSLLLFIGFVALLYGFVLLRISTLSSQQPSPDSVTGQVQAAHVPHIDESVAKRLESLHNNSVNVQTLFNESRSNPFQ
ncbi:MAG TPA: hypothetical protein VD706_03135 [Candidatus Saccharimonadales bacterium]|nr:hypothetical protein [Candidatus Saccharimonadales bacterium]